jgi:hypothetical protein
MALAVNARIAWRPSLFPGETTSMAATTGPS